MKNQIKTHSKIIQLIKTHGPMTAKSLAQELQLTAMGIRQHMLLLEERGDVNYEDIKAKRGRPTRVWSLTQQSNSHFPDGHEVLTMQLIDSVKQVFGDDGLDQLISQREKQTYEIYSQAIIGSDGLYNKLKLLAQMRSDEGYMASIEKEGDDFWLLENHCSICAAATKCLRFCRSELELFQNLFKDLATITREEHIMKGARRCAYKVSKL